MEPPTYLANKYPHERDSHIHFDEGPHIYTIDGDSDYMSVTRCNHSHFPHFNADKIIGNINSKDAPEEIFTEGFCDLIAYNGIVKFNIFSHSNFSLELFFSF